MLLTEERPEIQRVDTESLIQHVAMISLWRVEVNLSEYDIQRVRNLYCSFLFKDVSSISKSEMALFTALKTILDWIDDNWQYQMLMEDAIRRGRKVNLKTGALMDQGNWPEPPISEIRLWKSKTTQL